MRKVHSVPVLSEDRVKAYAAMTKQELVLELESAQSLLKNKSTEDELERTVSHLQLHQIEIELQNKELREMHHQLEKSRSEYADLYDFAPIGYLTLDERGIIRQINIAGAMLLGADRERHLGMPFHMYVEERGRFREYLQRCRETGEVEIGELYLKRKGAETIEAELHSRAMQVTMPEKSLHYRMAVSDVTNRKRVERMLREKTVELETMYQREKLIALSFQEASLPKRLPEVPGVVFHSHYEPGTNGALVGGDWYDALSLPDGRVIISMGDVCGSGLNAAVIMASMRQVIRGTGYLHADPVSMLNASDKLLRGEHPNTIVTAFVGILDPIERTLTYASAGHPPALLCLREGEFEELPYRGLVLGLRDRHELPAERITITDGACLVLYTDGLTESQGDYGEGERRLHAALASPALRASANIAKMLRDTVLYDGTRDDVAILVMEFPPLEIGPKQQLLRWTFNSDDAASARRVRMAYVARLRAKGMSPDYVSMAELVFVELLGNVARYAPGEVTMWVDWSSPSPRLHCIDRGSGFDYYSKLPANILSESGRGLYLISMLTEDFYVSTTPEKGSHACAVLKYHGEPPVSR